MFDSTLAAYLLNPESKDLSVAGLALQYFDVTLPLEPAEEHKAVPPPAARWIPLCRSQYFPLFAQKSTQYALGHGAAASPAAAPVYFDVTLPLEPAEERMYGLLKGIYVLSDHMLERLKEEQLLNLYVQIELPLAELLSSMEYEGVRIDTAYLEELGRELHGFRSRAQSAKRAPHAII